MRTIAIDVGFAINGWAIIDEAKSKQTKMDLVEYGALFTEADKEIGERIAIIYQGVDRLIKEYQPDEIAIESVFFFKNQKTVINVAQVRGVIVLAAQLNGLEIYNYTPLQVKTAVTGYGKAEKKQVQKMVKLIFGLKEIPKPDDVADAIAVGVCHLNSKTINKLLQPT